MRRITTTILLLITLACAHSAFADEFDDAYSAACKGDEAQLKALLKAHPKLLETGNKQRITVLELAAGLNRPPCSKAAIQMLIDHGATVDSPSHAHALNTALGRGNAEIAELLLAHGADPNRGQGERGTPMHAAAVSCPEALKSLVARKGDVNVRSYDNRTPLYHVLTSSLPPEQKLARVNLLLSLGADVEIAGNYQRTPLHEAVRQDEVKIIEKLLAAKPDLRKADQYGDTVLHVAASRYAHKPNEAIIQLLLNAGADPGIPNKSTGHTAMQEAVHGDRKVVELFIKLGVKPDVFTSMLLERDQDVRKRIEEEGIKEARYGSGQSPLHMASRLGKAEYVQLLLKRGLEVDAVDGRGSTPLHAAARSAHLDSMKLLLDAGARVNAVSNDGSMWSGGLNHYVNGSFTPLILAAYAGGAAHVRLLLSRGADVNARDAFGCTALHWAAARGDEEMTRLLLSHHPRLNTGCILVALGFSEPPGKPAKALTPLSAARQMNKEGTIKLLVDAGAKEEPDDAAPPLPSSIFSRPTSRPSP